MKMTENYKIIGSFIKDMSSETPDTPTYIFVRDKISKYRLNIDINSKAVKNGIIEVNTMLKFSIIIILYILKLTINKFLFFIYRFWFNSNFFKYQFPCWWKYY